jgi:ubiquinone biosynthesis protein
MKRRQREVRECLADVGFVRGPFRNWRGPRPDLAVWTPGDRLRVVLERLGPVFVAFGAYLASREDLFPPALRAELASISPQAQAMPVRGVHEVIIRELGHALTDVFSVFEERPFEVGLLYQAHHAWLLGGEPVVVKIRRPGDEAELAADLASLPLFKLALVGDEAMEQALERAVADFHYVVQIQGDFVHEARTLEVLAQDVAELGWLRVPRVFGRFSTKGLLTLECLRGWNLEEILSTSEGSSKETSVAARSGPMPPSLDRRHLASQLCTVWLRQALLGQSFPAEPAARMVIALPDGRLACTGIFTSLPPGAKRELWEYLVSATTEDPDGACMHLLRVMEKRVRSAHEEELRHRFRQLVLFRDDDQGVREEGNRLVDLLRLHLRLAEAHGWRPPPYLTRFYRALVLVNDAAMRLAPARDSLRDGLENVRVMVAVGQFRDLISVGQLNWNLERYAPVLLELPKRLDEILTLLSVGNARMHLHLRETAEELRQKNSTTVVAALVLLLASIVLLGRQLGLVEVMADWGNRIGAGVFLLVGALLLIRLSGTR